MGTSILLSTEFYIHLGKQLFQTTNEEFTCRVAHTLEEEQELIEAGFEYVTERDGTKIYRKRKQPPKKWSFLRRT